MKDQYVGDVNDFEKYAVLRALRDATGLSVVVCWMLTAPDATGEGAKTEYLREPERYRALDPHVFDRLAELVRAGKRTVQAVEEAGVVEGARFFSRRLEDHLTSRVVFFRELWEIASEPSLVFFDPDIGLAPKSVRKGGRRSAMYVFQDELADAYRRRHSLVVYQHFAREQRARYLARVFGEVRASCGAAAVFALWSGRVAFLVIPQENGATAMKEAGRALASRWRPLLAVSDEEITAHASPPEITLVVPGYPPTKNEAKSLLSAGHSQFGRVRALLAAASDALEAGAQPLANGRLGLELVVLSPTGAPSDASNYLGGVGDVLEDKDHLGTLEHLGPLGSVALFANDRQIREVRYREELAAEPRYRVRLWALDERA